MKPGEGFEIRCFEYLKKFYNAKSSSFDREGGMDSTTSDIAVYKDGKIAYYIEAKDTSAQSGQFVLLPDEEDKKFVFSPKNRSEQNEMTDLIIEYMNSDFERFNNAGTAGESLDIDSKVFADWIIKHYQDRKVKYVISHKNDYVIFPIRKFESYFDINATFRIKKSGSSAPAKKDFPFVEEAIKAVYPNAKFNEEGKKLYVMIPDKVEQLRFPLEQYEYYLSDLSNGNYEVRKLSNTKNKNVIFSIELVKDQDESDLDEFKSDL